MSKRQVKEKKLSKEIEKQWLEREKQNQESSQWRGSLEKNVLFSNIHTSSLFIYGWGYNHPIKQNWTYVPQTQMKK